MLAQDEVEAYYFGRYDERLAMLDLLGRYLEDSRPAKEILEEIIASVLQK